MTRMLPEDLATERELTNAVSSIWPNKTWNLRETDGAERYVDGIDALRQSVRLALETPRYAHLIYSFDYGSELMRHFGQSNELVQAEWARMIQEALLVDDRIQSVEQFQFFFHRDAVEVHFVVKSRLGNFTEEISL